MLSLVDILRRIDAGELTADGAIRLSLDAIAAREPEIGAFVNVDRAARAGASGPLRGIAVGIKDIVDTADFPTEMGTPLYAGWRPRADATVVAWLKRRGATIVGKTTTTAFASSDPTATRNPRNLAHTPGGSSAGSAAAVAAGMIPLALGTQTGGSVIRPASFCGVPAIKPSFRLLPTVGVKCYAWTLDTVGLYAAGVADLAYALAAMTGRPDLALAEAEAAPRVGVVTQDFAGAPEPASAEALRIAASAAERAGAQVRDLALPEIFAQAWRKQSIIQSFEGRQSLAWEYATHYDVMPPMLRRNLDAGQDLGPPAYDDARRAARRARNAFKAVFDEFDVLLTYSAPGPAPAGLATTGNPRFNRLWTLLGAPCVNVPAHVASGGLPVGVQVVAPFGQDARALAAARFLERALASR